MKRHGTSSEIRRHYERLARQYDHRWRGYTHRTFQEAFEVTQLSRSQRVLDVGCGTGAFAHLMHRQAPHLTVVGIDATPAMVAVARERCQGISQMQFLVAQAEVLPFVDEGFDAVSSLSVLHHLPRPEQFLKECYRVLRMGGQLVISDWCRDFWHCQLVHYGWRYLDRTYVRMYGLQEIQALMGAVGLTIDGSRRFVAPPWYGMMQVNARKLPWN